MDNAWWLLALCLATLVVVLVHAADRTRTVGLVLAFALSLLLVHVPGGLAYAYATDFGQGLPPEADYNLPGFALATIGFMAFAVGALAYRAIAPTKPIVHGSANVLAWARFGIAAGWFLALVYLPLRSVPTLGNAIRFTANVWILGTITGLQSAVSRRSYLGMAGWSCTALVYPVGVLLFGGFLSFGTQTLIIAGAYFLTGRRNVLRPLLQIMVASYIAISLFAVYFTNRENLRSVLWSDAPISRRVAIVDSTFSSAQLFQFADDAQLSALLLRLNQNYFVGLAQERLESGATQFSGSTILIQSVQVLIPRILWPDKPISGGSPGVLIESTGLALDENTAWGVGQVLEFYLMYGLPSLIVAFVCLGAVLSWFDANCARFLLAGDPSGALPYFLPATMFIQPNGSLTELLGGAAYTFFGALILQWVWQRTRASVPSLEMA